MDMGFDPKNAPTALALPVTMVFTKFTSSNTQEFALFKVALRKPARKNGDKKSSMRMFAHKALPATPMNKGHQDILKANLSGSHPAALCLVIACSCGE